MNENQGNEYLKVVADIIETEMDLKPTIPSSTNPNDRRVFIYNQNFVLPTYDYLFAIISEIPGKVIAAHNRYDDVAGKEVQEIIMQRELGIDIMSRNAEARQRKEEVLMALASIYSQQKQEANGFRVFAYSLSFVDVSENEGAGRINRYRAAVILHVRYTKQKDIDYFSQFDYTVDSNS
jgi:hypothetical protein